MKQITKLKVITLVILFIFSACKKKSSGPSATSAKIEPLTAISQVSVITPKGISKALSPIKRAVSDFSEHADYHKDKSKTYAYEASAKVFYQINEILCGLAQTKYNDMLNKGTYKAQLDANRCSSKKDTAGYVSATPIPEIWVLESTRTCNTCPQIVKFWILDNVEGDSSLIKGKITITKGPSADNPLGLFDLYFVSYAVIDDNLTNTVKMKGFLKSTAYHLNYLLQRGNPGDNRYISSAAIFYKNTNSGSVKDITNWDGLSSDFQFDFAYNDNYVLRKNVKDNSQVCLDRNNYNSSTWEYGLYDAAGKRLNHESGFTIQYSDENAYVQYGYLGYWGHWFEKNIPIPDGRLVNITDHNGIVTSNNYTFFKGSGKLYKHSKQETTLNEMKGMGLSYWDNATSQNYILAWNGTNFTKKSIVSCDSSGCTHTSTTGNLDLSNLTFGEIFFYSDSLGGEGRDKLDNCTHNGSVTSCTASNSTKVIFFKQTPVYPDDAVPATLSCFERCPKPDAFTTAANDSEAYYTNISSVNKSPFSLSAGTDYYNYHYDSVNYLLTDNQSSQAVKMSTANSNLPHGIYGGKMFEMTDEVKTAMQCSWDSDKTCVYQLYDAVYTFYTWQTGTKDYNKFAFLKDKYGNYLKYKNPLQIKYKHTNDATYYLTYEGVGKLTGIPGKCVDLLTGKQADCSPNTRWIPEFTIADGVSVVDSDNNTYYIKALDYEQMLIEAPLSTCSSQGLSTTSSNLPTLDEWQEPGIGDMPAIDEPPRVIFGEIKIK